MLPLWTNREDTINPERLVNRWSLTINCKEENHSPQWIFNHRQVVIREPSPEETYWDKLEKDLLATMAWEEVVTANMETSSEITDTSQSLTRPRADTATPPRAEWSIQEVCRRRRHQSLRPESKTLDHTPVNLIEWVPFQSKTWQDSTKIIDKQKRPLPKARSNLSSLRSQELLLDQSHKLRASGHVLDPLERQSKLRPSSSKKKSNKLWRILKSLRTSKFMKVNSKRKSRRILMRNLHPSHRLSQLQVNLARWRVRLTSRNSRSSLRRSDKPERG